MANVHILNERDVGYPSTTAGTIVGGDRYNHGFYVDLGNGTFAGKFNSQSEADSYAQTVKSGNAAQTQAPIDSLVSDAQNNFYGPGPDADAAAELIGIPRGTVVTHDGKQIAGPGALQRQNDLEAQIRAKQAKNTTGFVDTNNAILGDLGRAVGDYTNTIGGISLPDSVAAQAAADPATIAAQMQGINFLMGAANGSLDAHSNPADVARQAQAADKLWGLTDPTMTANERYLMEVARQTEERDRRAAMDASLRNLAARGQLGSGGEIGAMLGSQQTTSQNRLTMDLGAQAQAVQRAMQAMGLYTGLATNMRNASDAMTTGNMNRRESAGEAGTAAAGQARGQSFNEAFSRGSAADQNALAQTNLAVEKADKTLGAKTGLANTSIGINNSNFGAESSLTDLDRANAKDSYDRAEAARKAIEDLKRLGISFTVEGKQEKNVWGS